MRIIGHRGAAGTFPENTLLSFEKAIQTGVEMIELDVHCSADGRLVVMHDEKVNRTTGGKGRIRQMTYAELQPLDAGKGEKIPLLEEVFALVRGRIKINIELKGRNTAVPVARKISDYRKQFGLNTDCVVVSSFSRWQLLQFRKEDKDTRIGILYPGNPIGFYLWAKKLHAFSVNLSVRAVNASRVRKIHARHLEVWVYTVNTLALSDAMEKAGVDAVFTDFPERLLQKYQ